MEEEVAREREEVGKREGVNNSSQLPNPLAHSLASGDEMMAETRKHVLQNQRKVMGEPSISTATETHHVRHGELTANAVSDDHNAIRKGKFQKLLQKIYEEKMKTENIMNIDRERIENNAKKKDVTEEKMKRQQNDSF